MRLAYIYALADPRTGEIRYVGKSVDPEARLEAHLRSPWHLGKRRWLQALEAAGYLPELRILDAGPDDPDWWRPTERRWVEHGREQGWPLLNVSMNPVSGSSR